MTSACTLPVNLIGSNWHMFQVVLPEERLRVKRADVMARLHDEDYIGFHHPLAVSVMLDAAQKLATSARRICWTTSSPWPFPDAISVERTRWLTDLENTGNECTKASAAVYSRHYGVTETVRGATVSALDIGTFMKCCLPITARQLGRHVRAHAKRPDQTASRTAIQSVSARHDGDPRGLQYWRKGVQTLDDLQNPPKNKVALRWTELDDYVGTGKADRPAWRYSQYRAESAYAAATTSIHITDQGCMLRPATWR